MIKTHRTFHYARDMGSAQVAISSATIQVSLQLYTPLSNILNFQESRPFGAQRQRKGICQSEVTN